jgi:hypothetical protein
MASTTLNAGDSGRVVSVARQVEEIQVGVSSVHHSVGEVRNRSIVWLGQERPLRGVRFFEKEIRRSLP